MSSTPLHGIRVLDLSRVLAGPWASQALADLGAEVIKVERPGQGDDTRQWGPPFLKNERGEDTEMSAYFLSANRGKRSITVDFTRPEGQKIIRSLAAGSDVLIENFKVGGLAKYDLDYVSLEAQCPTLVYCSITGFGQTGPMRLRPGYDLLIQGLGGLMSITGPADGKPHKAGVAIADLCAGLYATIAIQGALLERARSGKGQHIDLALLDVQAAMLANQASNWLAGRELPRRMGNAHPNIAPYEVFEARDGFLILAIGNDAQFRRFAELAGEPELADDPRFATNALRVNNRAALCSKVAALIRERPQAEWLTDLEARSIPAGPINNVSQVYELKQIKERGMTLSLNHESLGAMPVVVSPIRYSRSAAQSERPPPMLGEHTATVLGEALGYSAAEIDALRAKKII